MVDVKFFTTIGAIKSHALELHLAGMRQLYKKKPKSSPNLKNGT